jgi:hypothetical protein
MCESTHKNLEVLAKSLSEMLSFEEKKVISNSNLPPLKRKKNSSSTLWILNSVFIGQLIVFLFSKKLKMITVMMSSTEKRQFPWSHFLTKSSHLTWFLPHVSKLPDIKSSPRGSHLGPQSYFEVTLCPCGNPPFSLQSELDSWRARCERWDSNCPHVHVTESLRVASAPSPLHLDCLSKIKKKKKKKKTKKRLSFIMSCF